MKRHLVKCSVLQCVVAAAILMATSITASAQAQYVTQVRRQLNVIKGVVEDSGFEKTHEYKIDRLSRNGTDSFTLTLKKGWEYVLVSVCDRDCTDVDITVYDENNNQIASDTKVDDLPVVKVSPRWTGEFRIKIKMYRCSNNPCYYGIGVFGQ